MRIMVVMGGFLPAKRYGGPVVSIENMVNFLTKQEFYIVARDHDWKSDEKLSGINEGWNTFGNNTRVIYLSDNEHNVKRYVALIQGIKPDLIYINGYYLSQMFIPAIRATQKCKKMYLMAPRGNLNKGAMDIKSAKKYTYTIFMRCLINKKYATFQSTSKEETEQTHKLLGIELNRIVEVENIPSLPKNTLNHRKKTNGFLRCCFFSRICEKKNLIAAIRILQKVTANIEFNIYGNLEDKYYWAQCEKEISDLPTNVSANYCGEYTHSDVFNLMSQNDVFLFPTFSENYGHVIIEALLSGLPVIISDQTPWNKVNKAHVGFALPLNETTSFVRAIEEYAAMGESDFSKLRDSVVLYAKDVLQLDKLKEKYEMMFEKAAKHN